MVIKDWERVSVMQRSSQHGEKHAVFTTKEYDTQKTALCTEETRACSTVDARGKSQRQKKTKKKQKKKRILASQQEPDPHKSDL